MYELFQTYVQTGRQKYKTNAIMKLLTDAPPVILRVWHILYVMRHK